MRWTDLLDMLRRASGLSDREIAKLEKRKALRVERRFALVAQREDGESVAMMALDCAATGLKVEVGKRLKKDEIVKLAVKDFEKRRESINDAEAPRAKVVWVRKSRELMTYELGLAFILDSAEQRRGVAYFLLNECKVGISNPKENRRAPRISTGLNVQVRLQNGALITATVKDIAVGGVLMVTKGAIERKTAVEVRLFLADDPTKPMECQGTVVRCLVSSRDHFEIGVAFTGLTDEQKNRLVNALSKMLHSQSKMS